MAILKAEYQANEKQQEITMPASHNCIKRYTPNGWVIKKLFLETKQEVGG